MIVSWDNRNTKHQNWEEWKMSGDLHEYNQFVRIKALLEMLHNAHLIYQCHDSRRHVPPLEDGDSIIGHRVAPAQSLSFADS